MLAITKAMVLFYCGLSVLFRGLIEYSVNIYFFYQEKVAFI